MGSDSSPSTRVPDVATVFEAAGRTLERCEEEGERSRENHPWRNHPRRIGSYDVALTLGLGRVVEVEPEWCESCRKLTRAASYYRSVTTGTVAAVGRRMRKLVAMGLLALDEDYPSVYTITGEGEALLDDAREKAIEYLREAVA